MMWQVKMCDPLLTSATPERVGDEQLTIKRCTKYGYYYPDAGLTNTRFNIPHEFTPNWFIRFSTVHGCGQQTHATFCNSKLRACDAA